MDIKNSQTKILDILMQMPCHIYWEDKDGVVLGCNQHRATCLGFDSPEAIIGKSHEQIYSEADIEMLAELSQKVVTTGETVEAQECVSLPNGTSICLQSYKTPLRDEQDNIIGLMGISFEIGEDKAESKFLRHLINMLPGHIWWKDKQDKILGCNLEMAQMFGFSEAKDLVGATSLKALDHIVVGDLRNDVVKSVSEIDAQVIETGQVFRGEEHVLNKGKNEIYLSTKAPLKDFDGKITGILGVAQNITDYKTELETLRHVLSILPGHIWWVDSSDKFLGSNQTMAKHLGYNDPKEIIGKTTVDVISDELEDEDRAAIIEEIHKVNDLVVRQGQPFEGEEQGEIAGEFRTFYSQKIPLKDLDGKVMGLVGISQDITELKQTQHKLEQASQVKAEFIANMSHDLRTPITGMLGETEFIEKNAVNGEVQESARFLKEATEQLLRLSNDILEYMSLESGCFSEQIEVFNPIEVINNVAILMRASLRHKSLDFKVSVDAHVPQAIKGYGQYFERILSNLVANAIKFTHDGSIKIILTMVAESHDEVTLALTVEDTGVGIPADKHEEIFEQFYKLSSSYKGVYKGSGLGLYSVKQYVGQMQGRIDLESEMGKGTQFTVTLPFEKAPADKAPDIDFNRSTLLEFSQNTETIEMTMPASAEKKTTKVLVVEDSPLPARAVVRLLKDHQCEVEVANNGEAAVEATTNNRYDLILMDLGLPGIDGIEAAQLIRGMPENYATPIIALTGHGRGEKTPECLEAGMQAVYTKPLNANQLKSILKTYIEDKQETTADNVQVLVDKLILDVQRTMEQFEMTEPKQLLDMLDVTKQFISDQLEQLKQAVLQENMSALRKVMQDLKGGLSYLVAPECNDLTVIWDNAVNEDPMTPQIMAVMLKQMQHALNALRQAIDKVILGLNN